MMDVCISSWVQCRSLGVLENARHWVYFAACTLSCRMTNHLNLLTWNFYLYCHKHGLVQLLRVTAQNWFVHVNTVLLIAAAVPVTAPAALCSDQGWPGGSCCFSLSLCPHSSRPPQLSVSLPWSWTSARDLSVDNIIFSCWLGWLCKYNRRIEEVFLTDEFLKYE